MRARFSLFDFRQSFSWLSFIIQKFKKEGARLAQEKSNRRVTKTAPSKNTEVQKITHPKYKEPNFYVCPTCKGHSNKLDSNFPASQSELYAGWNYHIPICRKCLDKLFEHYTNVYGGDEDAVIRRICERYDIYYNVGLLNASREITKNRSRIHNYISKANRRNPSIYRKKHQSRSQRRNNFVDAYALLSAIHGRFQINNHNIILIIKN